MQQILSMQAENNIGKNKSRLWLIRANVGRVSSIVSMVGY